MGAAIGIGDLDATAPLAKTFAEWLQAVFGRSEPTLPP